MGQKVGCERMANPKTDKNDGDNSKFKYTTTTTTDDDDDNDNDDREYNEKPERKRIGRSIVSNPLGHLEHSFKFGPEQ